LTVTSDEITRDLLKFIKDFNVELIPHMNEEEIHAYKKDKLKTQRMSQPSPNLNGNSSIAESGNIYDLRNSGSIIYGQDMNSQTPSPNIQQIKNRLLKPTHFDKHQVTSYDILDAFKEIEHEDTARLIGLLSHFTYWVIFGIQLNANPLNHFHLKQLFISILQCVTEIEKRQDRKKIFTCFIMPLIMLTVRLEVESIYRNTYPSVMSDPETEDMAMQRINQLITEIIDPNLYYSRFSFLESGKEAIDIKHRMFKMSNLKTTQGD
jgi:hypothetical protein